MRQSPSHEVIRHKASRDRATRHTPRHSRAAASLPRHRRATTTFPKPTLASLRAVGKSKAALAAAALACVALAALAAGGGTETKVRQVDTAAFTVADRAGRSYGRQAAADVQTEATKVLDPAAKAEEERKAAEAKAAEEQRKAAEAEAARIAEEARRAANPAQVAGLDQLQMNNAKRIVDAGRAMGLPKRAFVIAVATSMQECNLYNLASSRLPESYNYYNEGSGSDHDSVGLFQQRPSSGWGTIAQIMDPTYAASAFYGALIRVPGWDQMALTYAAQRVQVSAFPTAYAKHEERAQAVVDALAP